MPATAIYVLTIERFRGITSLKRKPSLGVNVIFGSDVGGIRPPAFRRTSKSGSDFGRRAPVGPERSTALLMGDLIVIFESEGQFLGDIIATVDKPVGR